MFFTAQKGHRPNVQQIAHSHRRIERANMQKIARTNEQGNLIGESHPRAELTDHEVDLLLTLRDEDPQRWSYSVLAEKFEVSKGCVAKICSGQRRNQLPAVEPPRRARAR